METAGEPCLAQIRDSFTATEGRSPAHGPAAAGLRTPLRLTTYRERIADDCLQTLSEIKFVLPRADVGGLRTILGTRRQRLAFGSNARGD
jgi:hypothetical protein